MDVTFIGAGNVAWHLAPALDNCGYAVKHIYSRNPSSAKVLAKRLYSASIVKSLDFGDSRTTLFITCVPDDAIEEIVNEIVLPDNAILIHTSGSKPMDILEPSAADFLGVFYPLQSFSKSRAVDFRQIPILVEGSDAETTKILDKMARSLSKVTKSVSSEQRKEIHLAAVFANNFTNHMLAISADLLKEKGLDFNLIKPLIVETINKAFEIGPENAQTGPAKRQDFKTLDAHIEIMDEDLSDLYQTISQHILNHYS